MAPPMRAWIGGARSGAAAELRSACHGLLERALHDLEALLDNFIGGGERHEDARHISVDAAGEEDQAVLEALLRPALGEACRGLLGGAVLYQFDRDHAPETAHLADAGEAIAGGELVHAPHDTLADLGTALEQVFLLEYLQDRERAGAGNRIARIG